MKRSKIILIPTLLLLILLTACDRKKYISTPCSSIVPIGRVKDVNITTNNSGGLDADNTLKIFRLVYRLRASEDYYRPEAIRLMEFNDKRNKGLLDG